MFLEEGERKLLPLKRKKLKFEVIPGITSPIAVLNYAGIPVTHRGIAQSFHIVTGMTGTNEKINWKALAQEKEH